MHMNPKQKTDGSQSPKVTKRRPLRGPAAHRARLLHLLLDPPTEVWLPTDDVVRDMVRQLDTATDMPTKARLFDTMRTRWAWSAGELRYAWPWQGAGPRWTRWRDVLRQTPDLSHSHVVAVFKRLQAEDVIQWTRTYCQQDDKYPWALRLTPAGVDAASAVLLDELVTVAGDTDRLTAHLEDCAENDDGEVLA
jgi:hypothetical protein